MIYSESVILVCEKHSNVHTFELNEYYNIVNHQSFELFDRDIEGPNEIKEVLDAHIIQDFVYILTDTSLIRIDIFAEINENTVPVMSWTPGNSESTSSLFK